MEALGNAQRSSETPETASRQYSTSPKTWLLNTEYSCRFKSRVGILMSFLYYHLRRCYREKFIPDCKRFDKENINCWFSFIMYRVHKNAHERILYSKLSIRGNIIVKKYGYSLTQLFCRTLGERWVPWLWFWRLVRDLFQRYNDKGDNKIGFIQHQSFDITNLLQKELPIYLDWYLNFIIPYFSTIANFADNIDVVRIMEGWECRYVFHTRYYPISFRLWHYVDPMCVTSSNYGTSWPILTKTFSNIMTSKATKRHTF
jgi:hypothetical protein